MTIMTISLPDEVKEAFDRAFEGEDKNAVVTQILQRAILEKSASANRYDRETIPTNDLVEEFRKLRERMPSISQDEIRRIRNEGRP
ncbi:MAG: hypothetical protein SGJ17_03380 [Hyphomicrobiales bacterium]|nr:hypothetical protein [Hyphomicrobiales bacterium]